MGHLSTYDNHNDFILFEKKNDFRKSRMINEWKQSMRTNFIEARKNKPPNTLPISHDDFVKIKHRLTC